MTEDFNLGRLLGLREAFSIVAARCSAAEAVQVREIKESKAYLNHAKDWDEFCPKHLHMSYDSANRIIRLLDEFGPQYFEVAQLTRISPKTYRAIAPAIRDQSLHHNGEAIALIPENAEKVAAAVAELRKKETAAAPEPPANPIPPLEKSCTEMVKRIEALIELKQYPRQLQAVLVSLQLRLHHLELTI
jgi:hypothetical protein